MRTIKLSLIVLLFTAGAGLLRAQAYQVGHMQVTYTDPARGGRSIQTEIYYPAATAGTAVPLSAGNFPVIVFGHGFVMTWDAYQNFWTDLVPKGYILAFPRTEGNFSPNHGEFGKDLAFLITKLQSEGADPASVFYNHVAATSAVMGHSMGGGSAFLAAENNTGITTMISFAAANTTPSAITAAASITVPTLVFSGENDCVAPAGQHQVPMYDSLASACKTFISVKGGAHCEFAEYNFNCSFGQSTCSPAPAITGAEQKDVVSDFLGLWLDYYLKNDIASGVYFNDSLSASPRITYNQACPGMTATGLNDQPLLSELKVFPNPAHGSVTVSIQAAVQQEAVLKIVDLPGRTVYERKIVIRGNAQADEQLDLSALSPGIYLLELSAGGRRQTEKLLITE